MHLKELHYAWGDRHDLYETIRATDLFAAMRERGDLAIPSTPRLARAVFLMKFRDNARPRTVTIKSPNVALYARDDDAVVVEDWLYLRGFLNVSPDDGSFADPILVST